ncbi:limonoid 21-O-acetyltransferse-like [Rutidosis leptorrhynchoides]|uniref:limonoid 21-O-acetyltransferse-like n=1 Tax=Rutidosis leptorrhynchoides TaxID=125765 RepID=UPI003A995EE6
MEVKIQSTQIIKPSKSTPENLSKYNLSLFDQLSASSYINLVLYYKSSNEINISDTRGQLVNSLSKVLTLFYPLAGRIAENGLEVDCKDQGVKYLETQVNIKMDDFLEQVPKIDHIRLLIGVPDDVTQALLVVQVNVFDCGSIVIGVSGSHKVTDVHNLVMFTNEWASMTRTGVSNGAFSPSFDNLDSVFPPKQIPSLGISNTDEKHAKIVTKRFVFNKNTISMLREKTGSPNRRHSRVTLVSALIWKALMTIDQVKSGTLMNGLLAPAISLRGKVGSPVSERSFGNVWVPYSIRFQQNEMEFKYVYLVALIEDTTRDFVKWISKASNEEICTRAVASYAEVGEEIKQNKFAIFTSWCRFPVYAADFGWGKPHWVSEAGRVHEMVTLVDDKYGDGIEAWVNLNEKDMYVFEQDEDILKFTS